MTSLNWLLPYRFRGNSLKRYFLAIITTFLIGIGSKGQNQENFTGFIYTKADRAPIENAHIIIAGNPSNVVYFTDSQGMFKIPYKVLDSTSKIKFTALGYEDLYITDFKENKFYLRKGFAYLEEVTIIAERQQVALKKNPSLKQRLTTIQCGSGWGLKYATYIPQDRKNPEKKIKKIKIRTTNFAGVKGVEYLPFAVNLYTVDLNTKLPNKPLLKNIIGQKEIGKKWAEVDISSYNIKVPEEGIFIYFEILDKHAYDEKIIMSNVGAISATPGILSYNYNPNYIKKSYRFFERQQAMPKGELVDGQIANAGWVEMRRHYMMGIEY